MKASVYIGTVAAFSWCIKKKTCLQELRHEYVTKYPINGCVFTDHANVPREGEWTVKEIGQGFRFFHEYCVDRQECKGGKKCTIELDLDDALSDLRYDPQDFTRNMTTLTAIQLPYFTRKQ